MNKKLIFSIFVVIIAGAGVLGYLEYQKKGEENPSGGSQTTEIDTSDWLTYRNEEYGFELKYPRDWEISDEYRQKNSQNIIAIKSIFINKNGFNDGSIIKINRYFFSGGQDIKEWLNENFPVSFEVSTLHNIYEKKIAMQDAVYRIITSNVSGGYFDDVTFQKGNDIYYIEIINRILSENKEKVEQYTIYINNVLESFKFIN